MAEIEYAEWTEGNHLWHSKFVALRDDKDAREVRRDLRADSRQQPQYLSLNFVAFSNYRIAAARRIFANTAARI